MEQANTNNNLNNKSAQSAWGAAIRLLSLIIIIGCGWTAGTYVKNKDYSRVIYVALAPQKAIITDNQGYLQELFYERKQMDDKQDSPDVVDTKQSKAHMAKKTTDLGNDASGQPLTALAKKQLPTHDDKHDKMDKLRKKIQTPYAGRTPVIGIVIDNLEYHNKALINFVFNKFPKGINITANPYLENNAEFVTKIYEHGFAPVIKMSMEPQNYPQNDPGYNTLLLTLSEEKLIQRMEWFLKPPVDTVINYMGNKFLRSEKYTKYLLRHLVRKKKSFILLESGVTGKNVKKISAAVDANIGIVDINLQQSWINGTIESDLAQAKKIAAKSGYCILYCSANKALLQTVMIWLNDVLKTHARLVKNKSGRLIKKQVADFQVQPISRIVAKHK